jgi:hypothetical protein
VLHQNLPHQLRTDGEEMLAVLERACALFFEPQIGLVDKGGTLQGVIRAFPLQVTMRYSPQFVVNTREHNAQGFFVTGLPIRQ